MMYMPENGRKIHTVSEVNGYVRQMLESVPLFGAIYIRGEIGNITFHKSGHVYFTLKDEESALRAVLFRSCAASLLFRPETGMRVICFGRVTSYLRDGCVQLIAERIEPDGIGALAAAFEQLKEKLKKGIPRDYSGKKTKKRFRFFRSESA